MSRSSFGSVPDIVDAGSAAAELSRLNDEIAAAERRLELMLRAAGTTGSWRWDVATQVLTGDARFAALTRQDPVDLEAGVPTSRFFASVHPDDMKRVRIAVAGILEGSELFSKEYRVLRRDGGARWVRGEGRAVYDEQERLVAFTGELADITEHKRVHEQLRVAQTAGAIGTFEHVDGFGTATVSEQFCRLLGLHPTSILPVKTINGLVQPDCPLIIDNLGDRRQPSTSVELRIARADTGETRWLARRGEYVPDLAGRGMRFIGVIYDITASKAAEENLRLANEALSARVEEQTAQRNRVWQNSRDLLAVMDERGRIKDANPSWAEVLGHKPAEVIGHELRNLALPEDADALDIGLASALANGAGHFEGRLAHKDGTVRWISWVISREDALLYANGRHVSLEKEQAEALRNAEAKLRQSQKMEAVGQLTGGIAHDFNNMLTGIIGALDIIRRRLANGNTADVARFMDTATTSARRAAGLTHRLLAFSRRQPLDPKPTNARALVLGMREMLERTLGEHIHIAVQPAEDCWNVITDANQLENALLNLAINARDAMTDGGVLRIASANVSLKPGAVRDLATGGDFVALSVSDNGSGMAADVLDKAFEPFFTTKPIGQGTGLGLSMVYGFAQQTGGTVTIDSDPGQGTVVTIFLPRSPEAEEDSRAAPPTTVPAGTDERVLVVEDDPAVRLLVVEVLNDLGYVALEAGNADEAFQLLRGSPKIDLLISDVGLPGMNGRQLAEIVREARPDLRVLFMTGYSAHAERRANFLGEGMDMILKPFDLGGLAKKVKSMIG